MIANPSGKAPKPTRMLVMAAAEPREILKVAAARTGSVMYFTPISVKISVAAPSISRVSHGVKRHRRDTFSSFQRGGGRLHSVSGWRREGPHQNSTGRGVGATDHLPCFT